MAVIEKFAESKGPKIHALIRLSNVLGLRREELVNLNINDYKQPRLHIATIKHGKTVDRLLDSRTCEILQTWLDVLQTLPNRQDTRAIFIGNRKGARMSPNAIGNIQREIRLEAGIYKNRAGFHATRRGRVTALHKRGLSESELVSAWGWKDAGTVHRYIRLQPSDVEAKLEKVDPYFKK
jgi:integrase